MVKRLALFVEHAGIHGGAVELPQLKYVADFDAAGDLQAAAAGRTGIARLDVADIDRSRIRQIAPPIHATIVHVLLIGAADEIRQVCRGMVDIDAALETDRADEAGLGACGGRIRSAPAI